MELKPCPFCGKEPKLFESGIAENGFVVRKSNPNKPKSFVTGYFVSCSCTQTKHFSTPAEALKVWYGGVNNSR